MKLMHLYKRITAIILSFTMIVQTASAAVPSYGESIEPATGLATQYGYLSFDASEAGILYVNRYTAKPHLRRSDLSLGGNRAPVSIEFWYDEINYSDDSTAFANPYGLGWRSVYNELLKYLNNKNQFAWQNGNGTWIFFADTGEIDNYGRKIWRETAATEDSFTGAVLYLDGNINSTDFSNVYIESEEKTHYFDSFGRLVVLSDRFDNQIKVTYSANPGPQIASVSDGVNRKYVFNYVDGYLCDIHCETANGVPIQVAGETVGVQYRIQNGLLTTCEGRNHYAYDSNNRLIALWTAYGLGYEITYASNSWEATQIQQKAGMGGLAPETGAITEITKQNNQITISDSCYSQTTAYDKVGRPLLEYIYQTVDEIRNTPSTISYGREYTYGLTQREDGQTVSQLVGLQILDGAEIQSHLYSEDNSQFVYSPIIAPPVEPIEEVGIIRDRFGNIISEVSSNGGLTQKTLYSYSSNGNSMSSITDTNGITTTFSYDPLTGLLESTTDGLGKATYYGYNSHQELISVTMPVHNLANGASEMQAQYNYENGKIKTISYGSFLYEFSYDVWGNLIQVKMGGSSLITYSYGNEPYKGQVKGVTYGNGQQALYNYNELGQILQMGYTNQPGRFTYQYDEHNALLSVTDSLTGQTTTINENGTILKDAAGAVLYQIHVSEENNEKLESIWGTDYRSGLSETANERNNSLTKSLSLAREGSALFSSLVQYDALGRLTEKTLSNNTVSLRSAHAYQIKNGVNGNVTNAYMVDSLTTGLHGSYQYNYDAAGRLISEKTVFSKSDALTESLVPVEEELTFSPIDSAGVEAIRPGQGGGLNPGDPIPVDPPFPPVQTGIWDISGETTYTYDEAGQLTEVNHSNGLKYSYQYDKAGNVVSFEKLQEHFNAYVFEEARYLNYNSSGLLSDYTDFSQGKKVEYTLDSMGNPIGIKELDIRTGKAISEKNLMWWEGRMLTGIQMDSNNYIQYTYNADGLRIKKTICENGKRHDTDYIWSEGRLLAEKNTNRTTTILYDAENAPIGFLLEENFNGQTQTSCYYYLKNLQGDITHILDENGQTVAVYRYDPWGKWEAEGDLNLAEINPCTYRGYYRDSETGYYYLQSRYYNPEIGRFLNVDDSNYLLSSEKISNYNLFAYCINNPTMCYDPAGTLGLLSWIIIGVVVGGVAGAVASQMIYGYVNGWWVLGGAIVGGVVGYIGGAFFNAAGVVKAGSLSAKIKMSKVRTLGQIGESVIKGMKNTARIESISRTASYRIPDILNYAYKVIGDVKNVQYLSFTSQLRDYHLFAQRYGFDFYLYVKQTTQLSSTIKSLVDAGEIIIIYIKN